MAGVRIFKVDLKELREDEKKVIRILEKVGKVIHKMWDAQVPTGDRTTFYDEGITRTEVIEAAAKDPDILSPYTVVRRDKNGQLYSIPYSVEYKEGISKVTTLLKEIEKITQDSHFRKFVSDTRKCFERGDFDGALVSYLRDGRSKIGFLMGPIETYLDKLMGVKKAWQFNLRVMRDSETDEAQKMIDVTKSMPILKPYLSVGQELKGNVIKMRVDDVVMFAGRQATSNSASTNLPNEADLVRKYGTKILVYKNSLETRFKDYYAKYIKIFSGMDFKIDVERLRDSAARLIILHEISEALVKFPDAAARLKGDENAVRELNAYLMAVKSANYDVISGIVDEQEYEEILFMLLVAGMERCARMYADPSVYEYARGFAVLFNYLSLAGAMRVKGSKIIVDTNKLSTSVDSLASVVVSIYHEGRYEDSQKFFGEYGSFEILKKLPLKMEKAF